MTTTYKKVMLEMMQKLPDTAELMTLLSTTYKVNLKKINNNPGSGLVDLFGSKIKDGMDVYLAELVQHLRKFRPKKDSLLRDLKSFQPLAKEHPKVTVAGFSKGVVDLMTAHLCFVNKLILALLQFRDKNCFHYVNVCFNRSLRMSLSHAFQMLLDQIMDHYNRVKEGK